MATSKFLAVDLTDPRKAQAILFEAERVHVVGYTDAGRAEDGFDWRVVGLTPEGSEALGVGDSTVCVLSDDWAVRSIRQLRDSMRSERDRLERDRPDCLPGNLELR